jgi:hypothetical protein
LFLQAGQVLAPVALRILSLIAESEIVLGDETPIRQQDQDGKGYFWTFGNGELVAYVYSSNRSGETPKKILGGTKGVLVVGDLRNRRRIGEERRTCQEPSPVPTRLWPSAQLPSDSASGEGWACRSGNRCPRNSIALGLPAARGPRAAARFPFAGTAITGVDTVEPHALRQLARRACAVPDVPISKRREGDVFTRCARLATGSASPK